MQADFWHEMWESGVVGFHQKEINRFLRDFWPRLSLRGDEQVLVPLCGKTLDMLWLRDLGHDVIGVELSQKALDEFLQENSLTALPVQHDCYCGYELEQMTLLCGDFFGLTAEDCKAVGAVYDRAAIVALPPQMRREYAQHLQRILPKGVPFLMVIMEYDQSSMAGPPFSVSEQEVRQLFGGFSSIEVADQEVFERKGNRVVEKVLILRP